MILLKTNSMSPHFVKKVKCFYPIKSKDLFFGQDKNNKKLMVVHVNILDKFVLKFLPPPYVIKVTHTKTFAITPNGDGGQYLHRQKAKEKPSGLR